MARTARMTLVELMVLKQDIGEVIYYLGKKGCFQFQRKNIDSKSEQNPVGEILLKLKNARSYLEIDDITKNDIQDAVRLTAQDSDDAGQLLQVVEELQQKEHNIREELKRVSDASVEAHSFANLKTAFGDLERMSFLSLRIGKIDPEVLDELKFAVSDRAIIVNLGDDKSKILAATSRKGRFALDVELKKFGFVNMEIPQDFKGVPDDVLKTLEQQQNDLSKQLDNFIEERKNLAKTQCEKLKRLLSAYSIENQIIECESSLESTSLVYRITGWIAESDCHTVMTEIDSITKGRSAIRIYEPGEIPMVASGQEKVPVKLKHGKVVRAFERMIFSYGSPLYGTIDPTPFVAIFFTVLFGIMFGDAGQGLFFLLAGVLMALKVVKVGNWNNFAPIFMCIGVSSTIMGILTGEFFATKNILVPVSEFITGLYGQPHSPILNMEFWEAKSPLTIIFGIFGVTIGLGFIINSIGLIINIINRISRRQWGSALFGKTGVAGALFFWYVVVFIIRIAAFDHSPCTIDWVCISVLLFFAAFGEPFERLFDGHRPAIENGIGAMIIGGVVELIEVISTYLSNSISFVRVGAFALAHAVLGFIIHMMSESCGPIGGIFVLVIGNAIVIVLEGMIVAIQVIRLQYYEFFSKFFNETGREFIPFAFECK